MTVLATAAALSGKLLLIPLKVCPKAPPGAQKYMDQFTGYSLWVAVSVFFIGFALSITAIVVGKTAHMPHMSQGGVFGLVGVIVGAILYMIFPGIINDMLGSGCI